MRILTGKPLSWLILISLRVASQIKQQSSTEAYNKTANKLGAKIKPNKFILKKAETLKLDEIQNDCNLHSWLYSLLEFQI